MALFDTSLLYHREHELELSGKVLAAPVLQQPLHLGKFRWMRRLEWHLSLLFYR